MRYQGITNTIGALSVTRLTDAAIRATTIDLWDGDLKGFGLRVNKGGSKSFIVLMGSGKRQVIGRYPLISLSEARSEAKRLLAEKTLGKHVQTRTAHSLAADAYLAACKAKNRHNTYREYERYLRSFRFPTYLDDINPRNLLDQIHAHPSSHHAFTAIRAYLKWCVSQHYLDRNPLEASRTPPAGRSRDRVLSDQELGEIYHTALQGTDSFSRLIVFLCLTGQRRGESSLLTWDMVNLEEKTITFPASITKNKREHTIPYGDNVSKVVGVQGDTSGSAHLYRSSRGGALVGWSKLKPAFDKKHTVRHYTLHDIRRTVSSGLAKLGVPIHVTEKLLNHQGTISGVAAVYNRYTYLPEMREALNVWQAHLSSLLVDRENKRASDSQNG